MSVNPTLTDRELAKLIQRQNQAASVSVPTDDLFAKQLFAFRNQTQDELLETTQHVKLMWDAIEAHIKPKEQKQTPIFTLKKIGLAAAMLLIVAFAGWFLYFMQDTPIQYTSGDAIELITLSDGSQITLRPHSTLTQVESTASKTNFSLAGEAYFNVQNSPDRIFSVQTYEGLIRVLGTSFNVSTWGGYSRVFLVQGSVEVKDKHAIETRMLSPNEFIELTPTGFSAIQELRSDEIIHWLDHTLRFRTRALSSILQELSHHFNIELTTDPEISQQTLTGTIILSDREQTLLDLGLVLGGRFVPTGSRSYFFQSAE